MAKCMWAPPIAWAYSVCCHKCRRERPRSCDVILSEVAASLRGAATQSKDPCLTRNACGSSGEYPMFRKCSEKVGDLRLHPGWQVRLDGYCSHLAGNADFLDFSSYLQQDWLLEIQRNDGVRLRFSVHLHGFLLKLPHRIAHRVRKAYAREQLVYPY